MKQNDSGILPRPFTVPTSPSHGIQWAGSTTVPSGTATVTISTTAVRSDSMILLGVICPTAAVSGAAAPIEASSRVDGTSFAIGYSDHAARARIAQVNWMIFQTKDNAG